MMGREGKTINPRLLPRSELAIYTVVVIISYSYATYQLFKESQEFRRRTLNGHGLLQPGWEILGKRYQDVMPSEWTHWKYYTLHPTSVAVYAGHVAGGFVITRLYPEWRSTFLVMSCLVGTLIIMGAHLFGLILIHALLAYIAVVFARRVWLLWAVVLAQLALTVIRPLSSWQLSLLPDEIELRVKFIISGSFCCLRFIGFGNAYIKRQETIEKQQSEDENGARERPWSLWEYLLYVFYLPTIAHGPYMPPEGFLRQVKQAYYPSTQREVAWVCLQWFRPLVSAIVMEILHHYLYISAFSLLPYQLNRMSLSSLVAFAEWFSIIFQLQYMVFYGFGRAVAILDGVLIPELPACMQSMYKAQDGWRC